MQARVVCECGNEVTVSAEQANAEFRCPRCGRRIFADENDAKAYSDLIDTAYDTPQQSSPDLIGHNTPRPSSVIRGNADHMPEREPNDPDATIAQSYFTPSSSDRKRASSENETIPMIDVGVPRRADFNDDFEVNPQRIDHTDDSSIASSVGMSTPKYDLSQRVMRPIVKPVLPIMPFSDTGEFGIHTVLRVHQRGGMGRILVGYDKYLKRDVAIKELHPDVAEDDSIVHRFIGEAEITAQLEHPGVVPIHQLSQGHNGLPYYTMKMVKGDTLQDAIKAYHRKPSQPELLNLVRRLVSVAKTMAFAHSKGVIHRDLKPANIMIGEHGETLVMDWGLAKPFNQGIEESYISIIHRTKQPRPELTMVGAIVGTPAFMSPEQAMAEENMVGPLSDVFSLGTILYYLLAGQTAFSGRSTQEVLSKVREAVVTPPSHIKSNVPHGLELICLKAMSKLPEDRYQGAAAFADDLCRWLDGDPISAEKATILSNIQRWIRRHRTLSIGVPCLLCLAIILTCINAWIVGQYHETTYPVTASEFSSLMQIEGTPGTNAWIETRLTGELLVSSQVKTTGTHVLSLYALERKEWDLSERTSLTLSLLEIPAEDNVPLRNFSIRLIQGESYREYKPTQEFWETRYRTGWNHFAMLLNVDDDWTRQWTCESTGEPDMTKVEKIEVHFNADAGTTLNMDNLKFHTVKPLQYPD